MMNEPLTIKLKTLTPLWTGGVDGKSDRLHATSIIGSLRWWYEAVVRGLGGYVSDPTSEKAAERSEFDTKAYEQAKRNGLSQAEAIQAGIKTLCPVAYLFGATGWARLFQLQVLNAPTTPLHFRTSIRMNQSWLKRVFGGDTQNIDHLAVPYGDLQLRIVSRGYDTTFAIEQVRLAIQIATEYGGIGARLQHGFGQIALENSVAITPGMVQLAQRLKTGDLRTDGSHQDSPIDLRNLMSITYAMSAKELSTFSKPNAHCGSLLKTGEQSYLPCAFDLRYKGSDKWGMRRWLEDPNGPKRWKPAKINELMGVSEKKNRKLKDEDRQAGYLYFGMPYRLTNGSYQLHIFGFAPPNLLTAEELSRLTQEYMIYATKLEPTQMTLGKELIAQANEGATA